MRLNRSTSHALRILIECAHAGGELVKVADLSMRLDITPQNVFKIVHILSHAGLVAAQRGRNGGVALARPASDIRIGHVVRAMEETVFEVDSEGAGIGEAADGHRVVGVNRVLDEALAAFTSVLDKHSLADMLGPPRRAAAAKATITAKRSRIARASRRPRRAGSAGADGARGRR